jgi:hypothetical protein
MPISVVMRFPDGQRLYVVRENEVAVGETIEHGGNTWLVEAVESFSDDQIELSLAPIASDSVPTEN